MTNDVLKWTVSNLFIVPLLEIGRPRLDKVGFINSFFFNGETEEQFDFVLHLLFNPPDLEDFNFFLFEERDRGIKIIDENDYPPNLVLITYRIPEEFKEDYDKIWKGQYSKLSVEFRKKLPAMASYTKKHHVVVEEKTIQNMIMDKDPRLRKEWEDHLGAVLDDHQELWKIPTIESETFKLRNYESLTGAN